MTATSHDGPVHCITCKKKLVNTAKKHSCAGCKSYYCGSDCLRRHRRGVECEAVRTMPTIVIDESDRVRDADFAQLGEMIDQLRTSLQEYEKQGGQVSQQHIVNIARMNVDVLAVCLEITPLNLQHPWWVTRVGDSESTRARERIRMLMQQVYQFIFSVNELYSDLAAIGHHTDHFSFLLKRCVPTTYDGVTMWTAGRIWHKIMTLLTYVMRVCPSMADEKVQSCVRVESEAYGETNRGHTAAHATKCSHV
jgi:hypothetical protein